MERQIEKKALIIGITGGFAGATAAALQQHGWSLRALSRDVGKAKRDHALGSQVHWVQGDAMNAEAVARAARGVDVIVHGANPPGYKNWRGLAIPMLKNSIAAAQANGARLVFPGNVYNFGRDAFPLVNERSPQNPVSKKGGVRVEMEQLLERASEQGTGVLIVRAGDFIGAGAKGSWLPAAMVKPGKPVRSVVYPGAHEVGHAWAYLPDLGETVARLLERESELSEFEVFHFQGHHFERGVEIAEAICRVAGLEQPRIGAMPWWLLKLSSPFVTMLRELLEMRYLWQEEVRLDNSKLVEFLGEEPHTPIDEALRVTLTELGCLEARTAAPLTPGRAAAQ
jgi:nucleoside-diphosphate-sugar epimerase